MQPIRVDAGGIASRVDAGGIASRVDAGGIARPAPRVAVSGIAQRVPGCFDENLALDLVGGRLPAPSQAAALAHAESCETCRCLLAELATVANDDDPERSQCREWPKPKTSSAPLEASPNTAGPYRLLEQIGQGAAGTVHRAIDERTGAPAAVKLVVDASMQVRFEREAHALRSLAHPAIVRYLDHGRTAHGAMYLAMQWLDGRDLSHVLTDGTRLGVDDTITLGIRLASALDHAHTRGCVHRDLSPKNVFLPHGSLAHAVILDFGLVRVVRPDLSLTASEAIVGTPYYMAPEQVRGAFDVDARADLFALGVLLYEAATGRRPFDGNDLLTVWQKIVHATPPPMEVLVPHVPPAFARLVAYLLEKDPARRPSSAGFVHTTLLAIQANPAQAASVRQLPATPAPAPRPNALAVLASLIAICAVLAFGLYRWWSHEEPLRNASAVLTSKKPAVVEPDTKPAAQIMDPGDRIASMCGGNDVVNERGGHYVADANGVAVMVTGHCNAVYEDCTIDGPDSVSLSGFAKLTLRRCKVDGRVDASGFGTLLLDHSQLATPPRRSGGVKVITR